MGPPTKKRKIHVTVPEKIEFDPTAREEYLTGFHKRKVARQKFAADEIAKKEKEEKLRFRRELRQQRKVDLEQHVSEVNRLVQQANGVLPGVDYNADSSDDDSADEFQGFDEPEPINHEAEYIDEDKYTTVTVESVNISRSGFSRPGDDADIDAEDLKKVVEMSKEADAAVGKETGGKREIQRDENGKRIWTKERPRTEWPKKKKKKFRYESKADRKATRFKEGAKKRKHATKQKEAREGAS